ncbi:probable ubiquitin-conjugating enzyme E2 C [Hydractinia symbiolongicarpus]|uniref:probable ubiquitin-conjugating enzyme E2 C n=1 Tax=Hydractinia symbiolongicarpus TaxID=13093 RepID=UPI00254B015A|nr:probable ubiquitin-conjugating enzyme E2 C [Hydractinia symbiolongicarpus]
MNSRRSNNATRRKQGSAAIKCEPATRKCNSSVTSRLMKELSEIMLSTDKSVTAFPDEENTFQWLGKIKGPVDSVYEGLAYKMKLVFPENYPYDAPTITFVTPCFHPNVDTHGNICLDTLKERWSSCNSVLSILLSIQSLLQDPNVDSPLNVQAAKLWSEQAEYKEVLWSHSTEAQEVFKE